MLHRVVLLAALLPFALAFGKFFNFPFGQQQQQQQQQQQRPRREYPGWDLLHDVHCRAGYVCTGSLVCVPTPADCPCPYPEDTKCVVPDNRERDEGEGPPFVCVRGDCDDVVRFSRAI
ncbi:hypothetical protein CspHIS471_0607920 [Cutaneotrichosporon sp. HIS471]|nr:hypothetical protein CspHIS471_0607920 [Cutaneotrichosporon sp. HIS471]